MQEHLLGIIIAIIAIIGGLAVGVFTVYHSIISDKEQKLALIEARNKERLALIEKGMDPLLADKRPYIPPSYGSLMWGLLLIGVAAGVYIGVMMAPSYRWGGRIIIHALGMLFGGIGLLIYYIIRRRIGSKPA